MPLMESIEFWSKEYAQSTGSCTSCSHSWQKDGKKYVYSLRHLYGLEGSRREYQTPGCQQVQVSTLNVVAISICLIHQIIIISFWCSVCLLVPYLMEDVLS